MNKKGMLGNIIGGFIVILIGITLIPVISQKVQDARAQTNVTGGASTALGMIPLFFGAVVVFAGIMIAIQGLRSVGLFGGSEDLAPVQIKKPRPKKQTYFGYVQERLAVEREMRKARGFFWWLK